MKLRTLILLAMTVILYIYMIMGIARAYEYEGDVDPKQFSEYEIVQAEQIGGYKAIFYLKSNNQTPRCVLMLCTKAGENIVILSYAYMGLNGNIVCYALNNGRYVSMPMDKETKRTFKEKLYKMNEINDVEVDDNASGA